MACTIVCFITRTFAAKSFTFLKLDNSIRDARGWRSFDIRRYIGIAKYYPLSRCLSRIRRLPLRMLP